MITLRGVVQRHKRLVLVVAVILAVIIALTTYLGRHTVAVLSPAGTVAHQERSLMTVAILLSVIVVVPVYVMTVSIIWKYRESNHHPKTYSPEWDRSRLLETIWWGIPLAIITILSVITWHSSYALDPFRPLASPVSPLQVQVVALDWRWLFIYPAQHVASINSLHIPVSTPVNFTITSDSVMNSFWIPQLGGQIYAMPGMSTELHLMSSKPGSYYGSSANISGSGFANMAFTAKAESRQDFDAWATSAQHSSKLTLAAYQQLAQPSKDNQPHIFSAPTPGLYDYIVMKYMVPGAGQ